MLQEKKINEEEAAAVAAAICEEGKKCCSSQLIGGSGREWGVVRRKSWTKEGKQITRFVCATIS